MKAMKKLFLFASFLLLVQLPSRASVSDSTFSFPRFYSQTKEDYDLLFADYQRKTAAISSKLEKLTDLIRKAVTAEDYDSGTFALLLEKIELQEELQELESAYDVSLTRLRYKKGLDLLRMLYEKILGLDHHFSSLQTYQAVMSLSNPNSYPEFEKSKEILEKKLKKDNAIQLPPVFMSNIYLSTTYSIIASFLGDGANSEREKELENISCILDFTLRMHNELSLIYYETEYLKEGNRSLKQECMDLFTDYVKIIGYYTPLDRCRNMDDWETVDDQLHRFVTEIENNVKLGDAASSNKAYKQLVDLEFSVDRLLDFINKYNTFISQGGKYYQKFQIIVSSYANEEVCSDDIPDQFESLKRDIDYSILKFNEAYNIAELKGSKLKDLLYGFSN